MDTHDDEIETLNAAITAGFATYGPEKLVPGEQHRARLQAQHPLNEVLVRPMDFEVLEKVQFYGQLATVSGNDGDGGMFELKEPFATQSEEERALELWRRTTEDNHEQQAEEYYRRRAWSQMISSLKQRFIEHDYAEDADAEAHDEAVTQGKFDGHVVSEEVATAPDQCGHASCENQSVRCF